MAGNEWINGYLDAILDTTTYLEEKKDSDIDHKSQELAKTDDAVNGGRGSAISYFIEEITTFTELDLHKTWMKATVMKHIHEKGTRLENFCWRIWHLMRKKKQLQWDEAQRLAKQKLDVEEGHAEMSEDLQEDMLDDSEQQDVSDAASQPPADASDSAPIAPENVELERKLYIVMISLHGLVRGDNMELGRDSDTGGQVKYVVEFARALATMPQVYRVDLLTRQVTAPEVDWSYGEPTEMLTTYNDNGECGESAGAYIVRIPCGPRNEYIQKEHLWPYIPEFVDGALSHIIHMSRVLGEQVSGNSPIWPHLIHGHYADAGDIAALLSGALNVPMVLTGHSLGRNKLEQLLKQGRHSMEGIDKSYNITRRIEAEEFCLDSSEMVVTSTKQEIDQQWGLYDGFDVKLEKVLRVRMKRGVSSHGRSMPRMFVIPPGMDFSHVKQTDIADMDKLGGESGDSAPGTPRADPPIWAEVMRFFINPHKPIILALARPDPKKNIATLVKAYGESHQLRELANLTLIMGNRDDIDAMGSGSAEVLTTVLKLIDKYDLYGHVAYPKHHKQFEVPDIYRLAAKSKGVFVNPALVEPFGLTLIEAAAYGLPMVATKNGGPVDIQRTLDNGVLVDPHDDKDIAEALLKLVGDRSTWSACRRNGLENIHSYSWPEHCRQYLQRVAACRMRHYHWRGLTFDHEADVDSQESSLRDMRDLSLGLSIDGRPSLTDAMDLQKLFERANGHRSGQDPRLATMKEEQDDDSCSNSQPVSRASLHSRKHLVVLAIDDYSSTGEVGDYMLEVIKAVLQAAKRSKGSFGVGLASALTGPELLMLLSSRGVLASELDVVIAGSGSELYYPGEAVAIKDGSKPGIILPDADYEEHIEYRWGGEGLRKSMMRVIAAAGEGAGEGMSNKALVEDEKRTGTRRLAYRVLDASLVPAGDALRKRLRMRGLRCHPVYCRSATLLHLLPLHASRAQALRYLFVRWGLDVANMVVVVGKSGDTDYSELLSGTHKTIIVPSKVEEKSSAARLRGTSNLQEVQFPGSNVSALDNSDPAALIAALREFKVM